MNRPHQYLAELQQEALATRKILESVPMDKLDWKPHEKSMSLQRLATHVAEIPGWFQSTLEEDVLDFAKFNYSPPKPISTEELIEFFEQNLKLAEELLSSYDDSKLDEDWTMRSGETIFFTLPRHAVVRTWCLNHWYHHRAQLGVYLRLLDVPLPATYGSSADTQ